MSIISTNNFDLETRLSAPDLPAGHPLHSVLAAALKGRRPQRNEASAETPYWPASYFGLDRTRRFLEASESDQRAILLGCSRNILSEIYYIEKSGMYFASKMCLLAESVQERMLFSLIAADEATHFHWISRYVSADAVADYNHNPFLRLLDQVLTKDDRMTLSYIIQVVLEGWGIHYYRSLAQTCLDLELANVFERMIRDEGRHHAAGLAQFKSLSTKWNGSDRILDILSEMFGMIQAGPQSVVSQVEHVLGSLTNAQRERLFSELGCEASSSERIVTIQRLIEATAGGGSIIYELEQRGALRPFSAGECAALG